LFAQLLVKLYVPIGKNEAVWLFIALLALCAHEAVMFVFIGANEALSAYDALITVPITLLAVTKLDVSELFAQLLVKLYVPIGKNEAV
jgi:hypothetical protein